MKWLILLAFVVISISNAEDVRPKRAVHRRVVRQAVGNMGSVYLKLTELSIIENCQKNGLSKEGGLKLQKTYDSLFTCMDSVQLFVTKKSEFLDKMVSCSRDAILQTKGCLKPDQQYFPEFLLDLSKSFVNFMYDDKTLLGSKDLGKCIKNFIKPDAQRSYLNCATTVAIQTNDDENIPNSKTEFCQRLVPIIECFPNTLNKYCDETSTLDGFTREYKKYLEQDCKEKAS